MTAPHASSSGVEGHSSASVPAYCHKDSVVLPRLSGSRKLHTCMCNQYCITWLSFLSVHQPVALLMLRCSVQDNNAIVREFGTPRQEEKLYNHVDLVQMLDIVNLEAGTQVWGVCSQYRLHFAAVQVALCSSSGMLHVQLSAGSTFSHWQLSCSLPVWDTSCGRLGVTRTAAATYMATQCIVHSIKHHTVYSNTETV